jgi:hypothetical protein
VCVYVCMCVCVYVYVQGGPKVRPQFLFFSSV